MVGRSEAQIGSITSRIRVNGSACEASLSPDGRLAWRGEEGERSLALETEALGFEIEEGNRIRVRAFAGDDSSAEGGISCGRADGKGGAGKRSRKDYVLEMETDAMVNFWSERFSDCFNSFGI